MSDLSEFLNFGDSAGLRDAYAKAMSALAVPEPMLMSEWMAAHFYLSAESSYGESRWVAWPFQLAIANCIGNDDIVEVDLMKSARVGYTKLLLAALGYFAHDKRRNQALWQPTDDDLDQFVKTELDPMLRDVRVRRALALALDREAIVARKFTGRAVLATGLLPPQHWAYAPVPQIPYDPAAAMRLLDEAGSTSATRCWKNPNIEFFGRGQHCQHAGSGCVGDGGPHGKHREALNPISTSKSGRPEKARKGRPSNERRSWP